MNLRSSLIMMFLLLAVKFLAAQENYVVFEGDQSNYSVLFHPGNNYQWEVVKQFNPTVYASSDDFMFVAGDNSNEVEILWKNPGRFYVILNESNESGCTNAKALTVLVVANNRTVGFKSLTAGSCFETNGNNFNLPIKALNSSGLPLESWYFPLNVEFKVNGNFHTQQLNFNNQVLNISDQWIDVYADLVTNITVEITNVSDNSNSPVQIRDADRTFTYTIYPLPEITFAPNQPDTVYVNTLLSFQAEFVSGYTYSWWFTDSVGTRYNFDSNNFTTENYLWDTKGAFELFVQATDENGCNSEIISKTFVVVEENNLPFTVYAGPDTVIGSCSTYLMNQVEPIGESYTYSWEPAENLDDPSSQNPEFTPGNTTKFFLTVTNSEGLTEKDSVTITVSEVVADAGEDIFMYKNSSAVLDGNSSVGVGLEFKWTTNEGFIESGGNTANPVITEIGTYYLQVTDTFGCSSIDSVNVGILTYAPLAQDDYDTTSYRTEVEIPVLNNDSDPDNDIDSMSLIISSTPFNGTAYVDYNNFTIHYRPNNNFSGTDYFEYQICDLTANCDEAKVTVWVSDFQFFIPDAFSPNGDGINDYFEIQGIEYYEGNSVEIFNRWGNKVYEAKNYGISTVPKYWDGKSNTGFRLGNEELPTGTYFYIINLGNGEKRIAGSVYLDR